jgi:MerR family regulatory protein
MSRSPRDSHRDARTITGDNAAWRVAALAFERALTLTVMAMSSTEPSGPFTIAEVAALSGLSAHTLRYYERIGSSVANWIARGTL